MDDREKGYFRIESQGTVKEARGCRDGIPAFFMQLITADVSSQVESYSDLAELEEAAYAAGIQAGEHEARMWSILAQIRDRALWRLASNPSETFKDYLAGWLLEFYHRLPAGRSSPYSLRHALKVLGLHRRLVGGLGLAEELVLTAKPDVLDNLTRAIGSWDTKSGELKGITPRAREVLDVEYPGLPVEEQVRQVVERVANMPRHGEAIDYIKSTFGPQSDSERVVEWVVYDGDQPRLGASVKEIVDGQVVESIWYAQGVREDGTDDIWPGWLVQELADKLRATLMPPG